MCALSLGQNKGSNKKACNWTIRNQNRKPKKSSKFWVGQNIVLNAAQQNCSGHRVCPNYGLYGNAKNATTAEHSSSKTANLQRNSEKNGRKNPRKAANNSGYLLIASNYLLRARIAVIDKPIPDKPTTSIPKPNACFSYGISCQSVNLPETGESDFNMTRTSSPDSSLNS